MIEEWINQFNKKIRNMKEETFYCRTDSVELDENYMARLKLLALVEKDEKAAIEYAKIQEILKLKNEKYKLLEKDENGNLRILKYDLTPESYTYIISSFFNFEGFKNLFQIEDINGSQEFIIKRLGIKECEIARLLSDIKNENLRNALMLEKVNENGKMTPAIMKIFSNKEDIKRVCCASNEYNEEIVRNIINEEYGIFENELDDIVLVNISDFIWENIRQDEVLFKYKEGLLQRLTKKISIIKKLKNLNEEIREEKEIKIPPEMSIGVELEMVGPCSKFLYNKLIKGFEGREDITVKDKFYTGVEVKSPILTNKNINDVLNVLEMCNQIGQFSNETCGGHIHLGADFLNVENNKGEIDLKATKLAWKNLFEIWTNTEEIMYKILNNEGEKHRGILYAKPFSDKAKMILESGILDNKKSLRETLDEMKRIQVEDEPLISERNFAINLSNLDNENKKTIEFRLANGPKNKKELLKNITLVTKLAIISKQLGVIEAKQVRNEELTIEEQKNLEVKRDLISNNENDEQSCFNNLINLLFGEDKKKEWYQRRYEKSNFELEKAKEKMQDERKYQNTYYGAPLSYREIRRLQKYERKIREKNLETEPEEEINFDKSEYENLFIDQEPSLLDRVMIGIRKILNFRRREVEREENNR